MDQICMFTTLDAESRRSYSHSKQSYMQKIEQNQSEISQTGPGWRRNEKSKAWNIDELFFDKSIVNLTYGTDATTSFFPSLLFLTTKPPLPPLPTSVPSFPSTAALLTLCTENTRPRSSEQSMEQQYK
ncbi:conserved hypothetical protein [Trichinella spiralis]|uniref:hypothetical protein n=1 Tax=Trichinella spiralis TaxID=6334 RepID=UPI0001EFD726|nr:conserved hypothetical protein [Trichinella spiralis]